LTTCLIKAILKLERVSHQGYRRIEMADQNEERQYVKDAKESVKQAVCPKCGGKKVKSCPGGAALKAVPGIWWVCEDCKHQW
jgi:hypothetical protein